MNGQLQGIRTAAAVVVLAGGLSGLGATLGQIDEPGSIAAGMSAGSHVDLANLQRPFPLDGNDECSHDHDHSDHDHDHSDHDHC